MSELPILAHRDTILRAVRDNKVVIVVGETGSGKTTQLPRFLYESGVGEGGVIGVTEPRRIAATSVARFVAKELGSELGEVVGYQVRFDDRTGNDTPIKFMTDGILLREIQVDPDLRKYSVVMVDEAHERSCNVDFLLGLLKNLLKRRDDLTLVVSSATIDAEKFSRYFGGAPVIEVSGRVFPVDIVYGDINHTEETIVGAVADKVQEINRIGNDGDVLVFMTGVQEISKVIDQLEEFGDSNLVLLPAHAGLSPEEQEKILHRFPGKRKVVVATNIAETSITIDGVVYVIDSGLVKQTHFHPESGIQSLDVVRHSKAGSNQRSGRAGRTRPGICFRMFTEENFGERPEFTEPEIRRMSLAGVVLLMESIGVEDVENFDFIDPPEKETFHEAYETLIALGAIERGKKGLTETGKDMARLPLDPRIARMVLEAKKHGCVKNIATVAAFLSVRSVFPRPKDKEYQADRAHAQFKNSKSDALTFLRVWKEYEASGFNRDWCRENFLNPRSLWETKNIREQLLSILERSGVEITESENETVVMKSVAAGLIYNLFEHVSRHAYAGRMRDLYEVYIHPGSSVFGLANPRWMVASEIVETSKRFARNVSSVEPEWLPELAPSLFSFGTQRIISCEEGSDTALVREEVLCQYEGTSTETVVGSRDTSVPIETAGQIQKSCIVEAEENGWTPLVFKEVGILDFHAVRDGVRYRCPMFPTIRPEEGRVYYCKLERRRYGDGLEADPQFPLFPMFLSRDEEAKIAEIAETKPTHRVPEPVYHEKAVAQKVVTFTEVKARQFQCVKCGSVAHVSRKQFQRYRLGETLPLTCSQCGQEAMVAK